MRPLLFDINGRRSHLLVAEWPDGATLWRRIRRASTRLDPWFTYYRASLAPELLGAHHGDRFFWRKDGNLFERDPSHVVSAEMAQECPARLAWVLPLIGIVEPQTGPDMALPEAGEEGSMPLAGEVEVAQLLGFGNPYLMEDMVLQQWVEELGARLE